MLTTITWDLEVYGHDFRGDKSFLLCMSYKYLDCPGVFTLMRDNLNKDSWNDKKLCTQIRKVLSDADRWITHNGKRFDVPFLNARLLHWGLEPLPKVDHKDTCGLLWKNVKMGASLANAQEFLNLGVEKERFSIEEWFNAARGNKRELEIMHKRCVKDVLGTEKLARKLEGLWTETQNTNFHACKNPEYVSNGFRYTTGRVYKRLICKQCKKPFKGEAL